MSGARARSATPKRIGGFEVLDEIGQGGMGVVYLARQPSLDRDVVLKRIRRDLVHDATIVERFLLEARAAAAVHHHNVVIVYDCFTWRGHPYIAQEWVPGCDLQGLLGACDRLDADTAARITLEVARGLEAIHERDIVHRDLKPANVLIGRDGQIKIADFGIAQATHVQGLTTPGTMMGSLPHMSPEQLRGERVDARSDLFNLGMLLYEMLTGVTPFLTEQDESVVATTLLAMEAGAPRPRDVADGIPRWLERLTGRLLDPRPEKRPAGAGDVRALLEEKLSDPSSGTCRTRVAPILEARGLIEPEPEPEPEPQREPPAASEPPPTTPKAAVAGEPTVVRPAPGPAPTPASSRRRQRWRVAAVVLAVLGAAWLSDALGLFVEPRPAPVEPAREVAGPGGEPVPPGEAAPPRPARLRLVARPWVAIRIDGGEPLWTPREAPIELEPGRHDLLLEGPFGVATRLQIELAPGEVRWIDHGPAPRTASVPTAEDDAWTAALLEAEGHFLRGEFAAAAFGVDSLAGEESTRPHAEERALYWKLATFVAVARDRPFDACHAHAAWTATLGAAPALGDPEVSPRVRQTLADCVPDAPTGGSDG